VSIIGCGRAGGSLGLALRRAGWPLAAVWSRSAPGRRRAAGLLDAPVPGSACDAAAAGDVVVVAVPDDAIEPLAGEIAAACPGKLVAHTSGSVSVSALDAARSAGARVASLHPLQTLPDPERGSRALRGAGIALTCDPADRPLLARIARAVGGKPFDLPDEAKPAYHAAAVFASNYVISAAWAGARVMEQAGIAHAAALLAPLTRASVENLIAVGAGNAITGPVSRGDWGAVRAHLAALDGPERDAYAAMAALTASLVGRPMP
jgi:predicted short-subunit dehydrogenase-like oxidoreductase (DUF2520 family)